MTHVPAGERSRLWEARDKRLAGLACLVAFLAYANTLPNGFVYDDAMVIVENPYVQSFRHVSRIFSSDLWAFQGQHALSNFYRPLATLSFLVLYQVFGGMAFGFHVTNVLLHTGIVFLLYRVTRRLFGDARVALAAALLFAVHPVHVENVAWASGLPDLLLTFFCLLAFWFYIREEGRFTLATHLGVAGSLALALLSKEPALTLPVLFVAYEHFVRPNRPQLRRAESLPSVPAERPERDVSYTRYWGAWGVLAVYLGTRTFFLRGFAPKAHHDYLTLPETLLSGIALFGQYLVKLLWPATLAIFYPFRRSRELLDPRVLGGLAAMAACVWLLAQLWKRSRPAAFALLWLVVTVGPVLNARWMTAGVFAERYLYLPSVGFCWLLAWAGVRAWDAAAARPALYRRALAGASLIVLALAAARTVARNLDWHDNVRLYTTGLAVFPEAPHLHVNLGGEYFARGEWAAAEREWLLALEDFPTHPQALDNLGRLYTAQKRTPEAIEMFERSLRKIPSYAPAHVNLAAIYREAGEAARAEEFYRRAVALAPLSVEARNGLGRLLLEAGRLEEAAEQFARSLASRPTGEAAAGLGEIQLRRGETAAAEQTLREAVALDLTQSRAQFLLGEIYRQQGKREEAARAYEAALLINPHDAEAARGLETVRGRR